MGFSPTQDQDSPPESPAKGSPLPCKMTLYRNFCSKGIELFTKYGGLESHHARHRRVESDGGGCP